MGVKSGAEIVIHIARAWTLRNRSVQDKILVKLDFANAFNRISRITILETAVSHFPNISRWVTWCYQHPLLRNFPHPFSGSCSARRPSRAVAICNSNPCFDPRPEIWTLFFFPRVWPMSHCGSVLI